MARRPLLPKQPLDDVPGDPAPGNGKQIHDALVAGLDVLTKTRSDVSPILKAAKAAKEALS